MPEGSEGSEGAPLSVDGLVHAYGDVPTLDAVSLSVGSGRIVSVLGPSGSGKTTLLRAIAGFTAPQNGTIAIAGVVAQAGARTLVMPEHRRVGMVFQDYALFPHMSVRQNVAFGLHRDPARNERVDALLQLIGMPGLAHRRPAELSGGQQQRVALARALAPRPALLLLDEPFANLDNVRRGRLIEELRRVLRGEHASALLVTHNRYEALAMSDELAVIGAGERGGRLLQRGTPEEVYWRPAGLEAAHISGEARLLPATARGDEAESALGTARLIAPRAGSVRLLLRPESLRWQHASGQATVRDRQFLGRGYRLLCDTPAGEFHVECSDGPAPVPGDRGRVVLHRPCWALP